MTVNRWFRLYDEVVDDPKVQRLQPALFKAWINFMCIANKNTECRGALPDIEDIAYRLHVTTTRAEGLLQDLVGAGLFEWKDGIAYSHNWPNRQFERDSSTDRVKRYREQHRNVSCNVSVTPDETDHSRAETEQIQSRAEKPPNPLAGAFVRVWADYPNRIGKKAAEKHFHASVKSVSALERILQALANYKAHLDRHPAKPIQNGSTWFNNWQDWEQFVEPEGRNGNGHESEAEAKQRRTHEASRELLRRVDEQISGSVSSGNSDDDTGDVLGRVVGSGTGQA